MSSNQTQNAIQIGRPAKVNTSEHYVTFVDWTTSDQLLVFWTLRGQKQTIVGLCSAMDDWRCLEVRG